MFDQLTKIMEEQEKKCRANVKKIIQSVKDTKIQRFLSQDKDVQVMICTYKLFIEFDIFTHESLSMKYQKFKDYLNE